MKKKCATCKKEKETSKDGDKSEFYKNRNCKDGFEYDCKVCHNEKSKLNKKEKRKDHDDFYKNIF